MSDVFAIVGGEVIDTKSRQRSDVLIRDGIVEQVGVDIPIPDGTHVVDARDMVVSPGLVDIQVHLREPGFEESEDYISGTTSAVVGGMTAVMCMPNTNPCIDSAKNYLDAKHRTQKALCDVFITAAITKDRKSEKCVNFEELYEAGARVFTDDGDCVQTAQLMRESIQRLSGLQGCTLSQHCEDYSLVADGVIDEGLISKELDLPGRHRVAEEIIILRDTALMRAFGNGLRYHVLHLSTSQGLDAVRAAQNAGVDVTCEVAPQHLGLTSDLLRSGNTNFKMNPPLRTEQDVYALRQGLKDGTITAIATDHAPHPKKEKDVGIRDAPPGMLGVETALSVAITYLVNTSVMTLEELIGVMSTKPAALIKANELENGGHGLGIAEGNPANITVFNPNQSWILNAQELHSKSANSPWDGQELTGKVHYTFVRGKMMCEKGQPTQ